MSEQTQLQTVATNMVATYEYSVKQIAQRTIADKVRLETLMSSINIESDGDRVTANNLMSDANKLIKEFTEPIKKLKKEVKEFIEARERIINSYYLAKLIEQQERLTRETNDFVAKQAAKEQEAKNAIKQEQDLKRIAAEGVSALKQAILSDSEVFFNKYKADIESLPKIGTIKPPLSRYEKVIWGMPQASVELINAEYSFEQWANDYDAKMQETKSAILNSQAEYEAKLQADNERIAKEEAEKALTNDLLAQAQIQASETPIGNVRKQLRWVAKGEISMSTAAMLLQFYLNNNGNTAKLSFLIDYYVKNAQDPQNHEGFEIYEEIKNVRRGTK
jgi:hypothetical protein